MPLAALVATSAAPWTATLSDSATDSVSNALPATTPKLQPSPSKNKPPIVESWVAFDFEPIPDKLQWDGQLADELAGALADRFPKKEFLLQSEVRVIQAARDQPPVPHSLETKVTTVRIRNEEETRIFQISDDRIAFNQLKGEDG